MSRVTDLQRIAHSDGRFAVDGLAFVAEALGRAAEMTGKRSLVGAARHLTASELVDGAIDLAAERWSLLGDLVLQHYGIRRAEDIGAITFLLIEHGIFSKEPGDKLEDFVGVADLGSSVATRVRERVGL